MNCYYIENIDYKDFYDIYESIKYAFIKPFILYSRGYTLLNLIIFYSCLLSSLYTLPLQIILLPLFAMKIATTADYGKLRIIFNSPALKYLYDRVYITQNFTL